MKQDGNRKKNENMIAVCAAWTFIFLTCMVSMLFFAANKTIVIADVSQDPVGVPVNSGQQWETSDDRKLELVENSDMRGVFCVPLQKGIRAENVTVENRYMDRELLLYIQGGEESFYEENQINGDISPLLWARTEAQDGGMLLRMKMDSVLEYQSTMDGSGLTINWFQPHELYDYIVILDPAGRRSEAEAADGSLQEKDVTLQVARQIQKQFSHRNVRLYCTRTEDSEISADERARFAEEVKADFYIRLRTDFDETNAEAYGIEGFYNEDYFIPGFGNPDWADLLTREVTIAASNRAVELKAAEEESILRQLEIPGAEISLGFLSNSKEAYLLGQESYQAKLAEGFVSAITKAVEAAAAEQRP